MLTNQPLRLCQIVGMPLEVSDSWQEPVFILQ